MTDGTRVCLLGGFALRPDTVHDLPLGAQRLVARLALASNPVRRDALAGTLWPDLSESRAGANLRTALWQLRAQADKVVDLAADRLTLAPVVEVDVRTMEHVAREIPPELSDRDAWTLIDAYGADMLPDWYDDWLLLFRERWQQVRVHALERLASCLVAQRRCELAVQAGIAAVQAEPLRESARRCLIAAYQAEGNAGQALAEFYRYRSTLRDELKVEPSRQLAALASDGCVAAP